MRHGRLILADGSQLLLVGRAVLCCDMREHTLLASSFLTHEPLLDRLRRYVGPTLVIILAGNRYESIQMLFFSDRWQQGLALPQATST